MNNRIKQAILENCGGFVNASDSEIMDKWNSLPDDVKTQYYNKTKKQKEKNEKD